MSAFSQQIASPSARRPAPKTFVLKPEHFAENWERRPTQPVEIGLRVPSEAAIQTATIEAEKLAAEATELERNQVYQGHMLAFVVARGMCSVHDVTQPHPIFELAEDIIPQAFKSKTIEGLFDEIELLMVDQSPAFAEATLEELRELGDYLGMDDPFSGMTPMLRGQCARYARLILDRIRDA